MRGNVSLPRPARSAGPRPAPEGRARAIWTCLVLTCLALAPGCNGLGGSADRASVPLPEIELSDVPFYPQARYQCGPASLAMVLGASGIDIRPDELRDQVWIPGRRGSLTPEMLAAARRHGRVAYRIEPELDALLAELGVGRPVLVFQNLGVAWLPVWHFAVVIGADPEARTLLLRSGQERLRRTPIELFERTWARADHWAMVVLGPGELPARADRSRFLTAVADSARLGDDDLARASFSAWLETHSEDRAARFGFAASAARSGHVDAAREAYEHLVATDAGDLRALNNLALMEAKRGCTARAEALIRRALMSGKDAPEAVRSVLASTQREIRAIDPVAGCPD